MENSLAPKTQDFKESWFNDKRNLVKLGIGLVLLITIGNYAFPYVNSFLEGGIDITKNLTQLLWTGGGLILSFLILTSKKTWRLVDYVLTAIGKALTFWIVTWDEFLIQEKEIDEAEEAAEKVLTHSKSLRGEQQRLDLELKENEKEMNMSLKEAQLAEKDSSPNSQSLANLKYNQYTRCKDFITEITPLRDDIKFLADYTEKAYDESQYSIQDARGALQKEKLKWEAISRGESAMKSVTKALFGDAALSQDAIMARDLMKKKIAQKIGTIKGTIRVTSKIMEQRDLRDRAKLEIAKTELKQIENGIVIDTSNIISQNRMFSPEQQKISKLLD